ncbi:MAG TPA: GNAT family N-acetyltransferase [Solirubrobacterales bacterium]|jgi:predicted N-acetyltransferase YhbS|nr:GNAT family N-acetyltransferase [Solirubrobacterales bacterium]
MGYTQPEPLRGKHDLGDFDCGEESLNQWIHRYARHAEAAHSAKVYVTTDGSSVVGYYALAVGQIEPSQATPRLLKGQPAGQSVPVVILARLAVDSEHQGQGLGRSLLQNALLRCVHAAQAVGIRALVVHAHAEAKGFYEAFGFEPSPTDPMHLVLLMKDIERLIAEEEGGVD